MNQHPLEPYDQLLQYDQCQHCRANFTHPVEIPTTPLYAATMAGVIRWGMKKHPNKGKEWIVAKYFGRIGGDHWVFKAKTKDRHGKLQESYLYKMATTEITRHVKVTGKASPDDPALKSYWRERQTKYGKTYFAKGSKLYQVAQNQDWICPVCGEHLFNGERIHTHHVMEVANGGNDEAENLVHVHLECHKQIHGKKTQPEPQRA